MNGKARLAVLLAGAAAIAASGVSAASAQSDIEARLARLERENAALVKENAALRENQKLLRENIELRRDAGSPPVRARPESPSRAQAADDAAADAGRFQLWGEGGASWSGGDPFQMPYNKIDFTGIGALVGFGGGGAANRLFDLTPTMGWDAAAGFDYRFAGLPWHVSGEFRYGQAGTRASDASAGAVDPALLALFGGMITAAGGSQTIDADYRESRWQADVAVGYDVFRGSTDTMQLKGGLRLAGLTGQTRLTDRSQSYFSLGAPQNIGGIVIQDVGVDTTTLVDQRSSFLGAGPRFGIEGSVPFGDRWGFDYLADAAVLFGTQKLTSTSTVTATYSPAVLALLAGGGGNTTRVQDERFATVFNVNLQAGVSYRINPNVKLSLGYRLDAYFNALNTTFAPALPDTISRISHGPRLRVTAQF